MIHSKDKAFALPLLAEPAYLAAAFKKPCLDNALLETAERGYGRVLDQKLLQRAGLAASGAEPAAAVPALSGEVRGVEVK